MVYNQLVLGPCVTIFAYPIIMLRNLDSTEKIRTIPALNIIIAQLAGCILIHEVVFYYCHRLLHTPRFYSPHHKKHHQWTMSFALISQYSDSIEHLFGDLAPTMIPIALFSSHFFITLIFYSHIILRNLHEHSNYRFPYYYNSERHLHHHQR